MLERFGAPEAFDPRAITRPPPFRSAFLGLSRCAIRQGFVTDQFLERMNQAFGPTLPFGAIESLALAIGVEFCIREHE